MSFSLSLIKAHLRRPATLGLAAAILLVAAPLTVSAHEFTLGALKIDHPWCRATPDGAKVAAGYVVIENTGSEPDRLTAVSGAIAGRSEIHEMSIDANGVMTMRPVKDGIEIPAGGKVELKPSGFHIMFMDLNEGAKEGTKFKGTLTFEKAGTADVEFAVEAMGGGSDHGNHGG